MPFSTVTSAACVCCGFHMKKAPLCGFLIPECVSQRSTDPPCWAFSIKASLCVLVMIIIERSQNGNYIVLLPRTKSPLTFYVSLLTYHLPGVKDVGPLSPYVPEILLNSEDRCEEPQLMIISAIKVAPLLQAWFLVRRASPTGDQGLCRPPGCSPSPAGNGHSGQIVPTLAGHLV